METLQVLHGTGSDDVYFLNGEVVSIFKNCLTWLYEDCMTQENDMGFWNIDKWGRVEVCPGDKKERIKQAVTAALRELGYAKKA